MSNFYRHNWVKLTSEIYFGHQSHMTKCWMTVHLIDLIHTHHTSHDTCGMIRVDLQV